MKNKLFILFCFLLVSNISFSQEILNISGIFGRNLYHSDNSLPITRDNDFRNVIGLSLGFKHSLSEEYGLKIEVGYLSANAKNVITETYYSDFASPPTIKVDLFQNSFPIDVTITKKLFNIFEYGLGVSLEGINREVKVSNPSFPNMFEDKLNMFSVGGNALLGMAYSFPAIEHFLIVANLKFRYLVSVWKNDKGRDLDNFTHKYFQSNFYVGIGYKL